MRDLIERLEDLGSECLTEAKAFRGIKAKTHRPIRERAEELTSVLKFRMQPRSNGGKIQSQTFFFETSGGRSGRTWVQTVKAHAHLSPSRRRVQRMEVTMNCNCPAWLWEGSQYWAVKGGYQYGLPRPKVLLPKIRDPGHVKGMCKHMWRVSELIKSSGLEIGEG